MKFSKYTYVLKEEQCYILHNTLFNKVITVYDLESKSYIDGISEGEPILYDENNEFQKVLFDNHIIVDDTEFDEDKYLQLMYRNSMRNELSVLLFVTRQCNFRCPYCYEDHDNDFRMEWKVYEKTISFIRNRMNQYPYRRLFISLFGGEPMLEHSNNIKFLDLLKEEFSEIPIRGQITTNGFLLDKIKLKELVDRNILFYQITIDGPKETHNKTRILANGEGSWDIIMSNLEDAKNTELNFSIALRTNYTPEIKGKLSDYVSFMNMKFGDDPRFVFDFEPVADLDGMTSNKMEICDYECSSFSDVMKIAKMKNLKLASADAILNPFSLCCYASCDNSFAVDYNGQIKKCTVALDNPYNVVGNVLDEIMLKDTLLSNWTDYPLNQICDVCKIKPLCMGRKCPNAYYNKEYCDFIINMYRESLKYIYLKKEK